MPFRSYETHLNTMDSSLHQLCRGEHNHSRPANAEAERSVTKRMDLVTDAAEFRKLEGEELKFLK
jgi:hypothetical protein